MSTIYSTRAAPSIMIRYDGRSWTWTGKVGEHYDTPLSMRRVAQYECEELKKWFDSEGRPWIAEEELPR